MLNPTTLTLKSTMACDAYHVRLTVHETEQLVTETEVPGPFAAGEEVALDIFARALAPQPPEVGPLYRFAVWTTGGHGTSPTVQTEQFSFTVAAPTAVVS